MGMYDNIRCEADLPGDPPIFISEVGHTFRTKGFVAPNLRSFSITRDGLLLDDEGHNIDYHGDLEFYELDQAGRGWVTYLARFTDGELVWIREIERRVDLSGNRG